MSAPADYQIEIRVRNGRILRLMKDRGFASVAELCRAMGVTNQTSVGEIINLRVSPLKADGGWRSIVHAIAEALMTTPDDLFSDAQRDRVMKTNRAVVEASEEEVEQFLSRRRADAISPEHQAAISERRRIIDQVLDTISPRDREVLERRMGLNGREPETLETIAKSMGVNRERVRQMEERGLRRLRHPQRQNRLVGLLNLDDEVEA